MHGDGQLENQECGQFSCRILGTDPLRLRSKFRWLYSQFGTNMVKYKVIALVTWRMAKALPKSDRKTSGGLPR
jgi:hypothetical protein